MLPWIFVALSSVAAVACLIWARKNERQLYSEINARKLAEQQVEQVQLQMQQMRDDREAFMQHSKAAAFETGNQLSNKLLEDHKREREQTHKQFEQFTKTATDTLTQKQQEVAQVLGKVQGQVDASRNQLAVLVRAMQNPMGAGIEGEITMNNLLQQHGFTEGTDYELQVHLAGEEGSLRPDCVIYLPHQHAVIIDSKASQHIIALFEKEGTPEFDGAFKELQATMRTHAKALAGKSYQDALKKLKSRNGQPITRTTLVMFVPNDEVVTRLMQKDPNLMQFMREHDIVLAGKVTLSGLLLSLRAIVREARQQEESHVILEMTQALMSDVIMAMKHADKVMSGIRGSAKAFDEFSASMNRGLSRMRKMVAKGLHPAKNAAVPANLPRYDISKADDVVQGEAEEVPNVLSITKDDAA
ncbi:MAG: DNA recombination protein RmuC [Alphaproteobacteria bacterium]|nr:DNA recombination protein RmuC [Alphaproteobacteria bacterium]